MSKEKEFVANVSKVEELHELLSYVQDMLPSSLDQREEYRDAFKELYVYFLKGEGADPIPEERRVFNNLYYIFDRFLKLSKEVTPLEYSKFLKETFKN